MSQTLINRVAAVPTAALGFLVIATACAHQQPPAATPTTAAAPAPAPPQAQQPTATAVANVVDNGAARRALEAERKTLADMTFFDFDRADLSSSDQATLDAKIPILRANPGVRIRISGNCDERGSDEYNLALGERRAVAAKRYLTYHGIDASRIETISYGKERPIAAGHDEAAWAQDRNDQFVVIAGADELHVGE
jgi:peptidoglycan-associated lipoprotein